jgi:hypothetical protein
LSWGDKEKFLRGLEERGEAVPALQNKPELDEFLIPYWKAFQVLSSSRQIGMGIGAIPLTEIEAYMRIYGIEDQEEREDMVYLIGEMDRVFIEYCNKK